MVAVQFPGLDGVLPEFGRFSPLDWGLGVELKGAKDAALVGLAHVAATFGHFGGSGTFLWVDPSRGIACAALTTREFGDWAKEAWPPLSDAVIRELAETGWRGTGVSLQAHPRFTCRAGEAEASPRTGQSET